MPNSSQSNPRSDGNAVCPSTQVPQRLAVFYRSGLAQRVALAAVTASVAYGATKQPRLSAAAGIGERPAWPSTRFSLRQLRSVKAITACGTTPRIFQGHTFLHEAVQFASSSASLKGCVLS